MEASRKRRGFMKGKLGMSFYRAAKPGSSTVQYGSNVKPTPLANSSTASVGFIVNHHDFGKLPQPRQKVSFAPTENGHDSYTKFENLYGVAADESVDLKAAIYISCVQERFRLE